MLSTMKELFINEFHLNIDEMEINKPYDVAQYKIGVKALEEDSNEIGMALVTYAIKKEMNDCIRIKIKGRVDWEEPVSKKHFYAIYKNPKDNKIDYTYAEDLVKGNKILGENGYLEIEDTQKLDKFNILDIQTDTGNYFTNGLLSHNSVMSHLPSSTGANAIKFYSTTRNRVTKIDTLKNKDGIDAGIQMRVRNYKNKAGVPWRDAIMNLWFDGGFNSDDEYFDFFVIFDFIHKGAGGVYTADFLPNGKIRGAEKVKEWIMSDEAKDIYKNLKEKVTQKLLGNNELDAENINPESSAEVEKNDISKIKVSISELAEQAMDLAGDTPTEEVSPDLGLE